MVLGFRGVAGSCDPELRVEGMGIKTKIFKR